VVAAFRDVRTPRAVIVVACNIAYSTWRMDDHALRA